MTCKHETEVYSRIVGYYRPVQQWNKGKRAEFTARKAYSIASDIASDIASREGAHNQGQED